MRKLKAFLSSVLPWWGLAILIPFALENSSELFQIFSPECEGNQHGLAAIVSAAYYRLLEKVSPFEMTPSHVRIVSLDSAVEGGWVANPCSWRLFLGSLLERIAEVHPSAILVDDSNAPDSCTDESSNTFFRGQVEAANSLAPLAFARSTWTRDALQRSFPEVADKLPKNVWGSDRFIEQDDLLDGSGINFGLIRLNCDVRKIPLGWYVYPSIEAAKTHKPVLSHSTFSVLAVLSSNNGEAMKRSNLRPLLKNNVHPFSEFINNFKSMHAEDLLCEQRPPKFLPSVNCSPGPEQTKRLKELRAKIVLVADVSPGQDFHKTPIGTVPGVELHANYIESLISGYYWKSTPFYPQLIVSLIWFAVIEIMFERLSEHPWKAIGYILAATFLFAFTFYYIAVIVLGYYFVLLPPSLILIAIRSWLLFREKEKKGHAGSTPLTNPTDEENQCP